MEILKINFSLTDSTCLWQQTLADPRPPSARRSQKMGTRNEKLHFEPNFLQNEVSLILASSHRTSTYSSPVCLPSRLNCPLSPPHSLLPRYLVSDESFLAPAQPTVKRPQPVVKPCLQSTYSSLQLWLIHVGLLTTITSGMNQPTHGSRRGNTLVGYTDTLVPRELREVSASPGP